MSDQPQSRNVPKLNAVQRRVFGVLIEKSLTTPGGYPLTMNALVTGCNQLSCREPVMQLGEGEVARALHELQTWRDGPLVRQAQADRTARANRFEHLAEQRFAWAQRERAIVAELLLRGPQTAGELKTNASRMAGFDDLQLVLNILAELARHDPSYVQELPRQPGRNTVRYDHLFYLEEPGGGSATSSAGSPHVAEAVSSPDGPEPARPGAATAEWEERFARLEAQVADLQMRVRTLQRELGVNAPPDA